MTDEPKLTDDERSALVSLQDHPGWSVMEKLLKAALERMRDTCETTAVQDIRYFQGQCSAIRAIAKYPKEWSKAPNIPNFAKSRQSYL